MEEYDGRQKGCESIAIAVGADYGDGIVRDAGAGSGPKR
jgi:hypothetical protein